MADFVFQRPQSYNSKTQLQSQITMSTLQNLPAVPDKLTDAEARKILEQVAPQVRALSEEIVRNNTRAEEGQRNYNELMAKANEHFGQPDDTGKKVVPGGEDGVRKILEDRQISNAKKVQAFLNELSQTKQTMDNLSKNAPGR